MILDGGAGLLVGAQDVTAVRQALARLRADSVLRVQLGAQAWARVSTEFSEARMTESYARFLCLEPSRARSQEEPSIAEYQPR